MHRTIKIEVNVPLWRGLVYIQEMQRHFRSVPLVKASGRVSMLCQTAREILSSRERGFEPRPGRELNTHPPFTVKISYVSDEMPKGLMTQTEQNQQQGLLLINREAVESLCVST